MSISKKIKQSLAGSIEQLHTPPELDERIRQSFIHHHQQKENKKMKKKIIALCLAAVIIPTGAYAFSGSYFAKEEANLNGLVDRGVKDALSKGLSVPIDQKITDQGLTIHFKEMYVEDTKILIHYRIEQKNGSLVPYEFDTTGLNILSDGKKDGRQVDKPTYQEPQHEGFSVLNFLGSDHDNLPFYLTDASGTELDTGIADQDKPEGVLAFVTSGNSLPQSINMKVDVNRIGKTKGSWQGTITIDQGKAKQATEVTK